MCVNCGWEAFTEEAVHLRDRVDALPERAGDFADGVLEQIDGMVEWAKENEHVTPRMKQALEGYAEAVSGWER